MGERFGRQSVDCSWQFLAVVVFLQVVAVLPLVSDAVGTGGLSVAAQFAGMAKGAAHGQTVAGTFHGLGATDGEMEGRRVGRGVPRSCGCYRRALAHVCWVSCWLRNLATVYVALCLVSLGL